MFRHWWYTDDRWSSLKCGQTHWQILTSESVVSDWNIYYIRPMSPMADCYVTGDWLVSHWHLINIWYVSDPVSDWYLTSVYTDLCMFCGCFNLCILILQWCVLSCTDVYLLVNDVYWCVNHVYWHVNHVYCRVNHMYCHVTHMYWRVNHVYWRVTHVYSRVFTCNSRVFTCIDV
jgi:hypothetical protein